MSLQKLPPEAGWAYPNRQVFPSLICSLIGGLVGLFLAVDIQAAGNVQWQHEPFSFYAEQMPLEDVLLDFASNLSVSVLLSDKAKQQTVNGKFSQLSGLEFLNLVSRTNNLAWFFDGSTIFVRYINEIVSKELVLNTSTFDLAAFKHAYDDFAIEGNFNRWDTIFDGRIMRLSGPPEYIRFAEKILGFISADTNALQHYVARDNRTVVQMLKVVHAYDQTQVEELARMLARIMEVDYIGRVNDGTPTQTDTQAKENEKPPSLAGLFGTGLSSKNVDPTIVTDSSTTGNASTAGSAGNSPTEDVDTTVQPRHFVAVNPQTHSIIVRDLSSRIARYRQLLQKVDVPRHQIEISASILDINSKYSSTLGMNFQNNQAEGLLEYVYTPSVINDFSTFRARVTALVENGSAKLVSEPSVLTLNNHPAKFKTSQTFYVRLSGDRAVDLVPINFGTLLQVTPNIVGGFTADGQRDGTKIHLDIHIEDGFSNGKSEVDQIPVVDNTVIDTEALVQHGTSLLIGGYQHNDATQSESGIPVLKDIPLLGLLFSTRSKVMDTLTRYFVITTRIVDYETPEDVKKEDEKADAKLSAS